ncbi:MAG TPA: glycosyltransferase family A protein [Blastocatellia bacterium]|nr:glycosyltransferase family A protein [Blastocatellia bacterium]
MTEAAKTEAPPKVSVIIPAYNMAAYISESVSSVLAQSFTDYEIIVVNDGSTDETERMLAPFMDRITYVRQQNRGLSGARNAGLRLANGEYVALLDADDIWLPGYLEKMVALLESEAAPDVVYPNAILFGLPRWDGKLFQDIYPSSTPVTLEKLLARECTVFVSVMCRRSLIVEVGLFDERIREGGEDFDLWLRMAQRGCRFAFTTEPLVKYRKRADSLSSSEERLARSTLYICEKFLAGEGHAPQAARLVEGLRAEAQARINRSIALQKITARDFDGASRHLSLANSYFRSFKLTLAGAALKIMPELLARMMERRQKLAGSGNGAAGADTAPGKNESQS